ncbi:hypothetical protein [Mesorhizobium amorphae]|uniref:hypothetical protein n=1 Tax=Mesorhizobium amorphae TaxID=71433 RepID=UPI0021B4A338|nr:hypothetical protein [Mesorhizobium amorphae]
MCGGADGRRVEAAVGCTAEPEDISGSVAGNNVTDNRRAGLKFEGGPACQSTELDGIGRTGTSLDGAVVDDNGNRRGSIGANGSGQVASDQCTVVDDCAASHPNNDSAVAGHRSAGATLDRALVGEDRGVADTAQKDTGACETLGAVAAQDRGSGIVDERIVGAVQADASHVVARAATGTGSASD